MKVIYKGGLQKRAGANPVERKQYTVKRDILYKGKYYYELKEFPPDILGPIWFQTDAFDVVRDDFETWFKEQMEAKELSNRRYKNQISTQ